MENILSAVKANIQKVLVGEERVTSLLLTALVAGGHVLIEDVPGMGKTVLAEAERLIRKAGGHVAAVHSEDKNFAMYEHLGYRITSELFDNGTHGWLVKALN